QGRGPALATAFGVGAAAIVMSVLTVLGLAVLFAEMAELMTLVRWIGAAYLIWLAYGAFRNAFAPPELSLEDMPRTATWRLILTGLVLQVSNPKALLFWVAVASVGGLGTAPMSVIGIFVLGAFLVSLIGHSTWAVLLSAAPVRRAYLSARQPVEVALGSVFTYAAFRLATARG
ncbi:MAG: LysE family transporter, partial [Pseudomonadota bacterium]